MAKFSADFGSGFIVYSFIGVNKKNSVSVLPHSSPCCHSSSFWHSINLPSHIVTHSCLPFFETFSHTSTHSHAIVSINSSSVIFSVVNFVKSIFFIGLRGLLFRPLGLIRRNTHSATAGAPERPRSNLPQVHCYLITNQPLVNEFLKIFCHVKYYLCLVGIPVVH